MSSYRRFPETNSAVDSLRGVALRVLVVAALAGLGALAARLYLAAAPF